MSTPSPVLFDRRLLRQRRARAARRFAAHDFLHRAAADSLLERRADILKPLPRLLELGCHDACIARSLAAQGAAAITADLTAAFNPRLVCDEEFLPFAPASFDCIISNLNFQSVNDLPGALLQCRQILAPDGVLLAALLGGQTLHELRHCLYQAEQECAGGVSPRLNPMIRAETGAALLQRAGFILPVVDSESLTVTYPHALALLHDLRAMGLTNILHERRRAIPPRALFPRMAALYAERFPAPGGGINATFEVIYLHGWTPAQPAVPESLIGP